MEYRILGPLEVIDRGEPLRLGTRKQQVLLAVLLLHANEVVSRERLIDELWGERPPATADKAVQVYVWQLRKALAGNGSAIVTRPGGYLLQLATDDLDAARCEQLVEQGRARQAGGEIEDAAARFREALALWRGPVLAGLVLEAHAQGEVERLEELRLSALSDLFDCELALGRHEQVAGELEALAKEHPLRERLTEQLMLALYRSGRQADALRIYRETRETLVSELGIEPSTSLRELEAAILRQEPDLAPPQSRRQAAAELPAARRSREVSGLPTGTVTFLFTDIEGSTRLLRDFGAARYSEALAAHRSAVRNACRRHGGVEVEVQGDEIFVAFTTAAGALAASRALTQALATGPIRVRVGVHTGTPLLTEEGYVGADVHRAARIAAAGHGGQVLVSESTAALVEEDLRPLGEYRLRDLLEPLRLFQLGEGDFPAPRASGKVFLGSPASLGATNLPVQPTPFVGRESELAEALTLLRDSRVHVLTLTGAGGSGKTRLALQMAAEAAADYPDGVFWVPLQALRDAELVEPTIAQVVAARHDLALDLASKTALLLLDNFEQVMAAAPSLGELCARLPTLTLLVTSREPLRLAAEREYPVPPLREREAVMLFGERARAVKPDYEEDRAVLEICRRIDCLPLAVELAAARIKALSTQDLLRRLDKRLPLLTGGPRDAPERQRTLRATIDWSYELLTPDAQRVFTGLAVFAGGCTLEAAEQVCRADVDAISELVDKSLLRREGERYLLLETIGEFAFERLEESSELEELRRRHAEYYLELARSVQDLIRSPQAAGHLDQLERDHDNLRAALAWLPDAAPDRALRVAVWGLAGRLQTFGDAALDRQDFHEAARLYRESLEIGRQLRDNLQTAYTLAGLAAANAKRGRQDLAACLWACVRTFEETSGSPLHGTERTRYERVLNELERPPDASPDVARGRSMTIDEAAEYALARLG